MTVAQGTAKGVGKRNRTRKTDRAASGREMDFRALAEASINGIIVFQGERIVYVNPAATEMAGYTKAELVGRKFLEVMHPDFKDKATEYAKKLLDGELPGSRIEVKIVGKDGRERWNDAYPSRIEYNGRPAVLVTTVDVTERRQAEEKLRESEERYRFLVENSKDIIWKIDPEGRWTFVSGNVEPMTGYRADEVVGKTIWDFLAPECHGLVRENLRRRTRGEDMPPYEVLIVGKDGRRIPFELLSAHIVDDRGSVVGVQGVSRDITYRKRIEGALKESETFLNNVFASIQDGISVLDRDLNIVGVNPVMEKWYGAGIAGKKCFEVYHGRQSPCEQCPSLRAMREKATQSEVVRDIRSWVEIFSFPYYNNAGEVAGVIEHVRDITERKHAEQALVKREADLSLSQEIAHIGSWRWDKESGKDEWTDEFYRILGYEPGEVEPGRKLYMALVHPDDRELVVNDALRALAESRSSSFDHRIVRRDGTIRHVHLTIASTSKDRNGRPVGEFGTIQDITERKRAEDALRESEEKYRSLVENTDDWVWETDRNFALTYNSPRMQDVMGYEQDEVAGRVPFDFMPEDELERIKSIAWPAIARRSPIRRLENRLIRKDGQVVVIETTGIPLFDVNGHYRGYRGMNRDITERKRAEEAVKLANAYNRSLIEASLDPLVTIAPDGRITDVNAATEAVTGHPRDELVGTDFCDYFTDPAKAREGYRKVFEEGAVTDYPLEIRRGDGHVTPVLYNATVYRDETGKITGVFAAARDITERKRAEEALRESEARYRDIVEQVNDWVWEIDAQGRYTYASPRVRELLGYEPEEVIGQTPFDLMPPDEAEKVRALFDPVFAAHGKLSLLENTLVRKDGARVTVETGGTPIFDEAGAFAGYRGIDRDITGRRRAEAALLESEKRYRGIVEDQTELICLYSGDGTITFVNDAYCRYFGKRREELVGHRFLPLIVGEDRESVDAKIATLNRENPHVSIEQRVRLPDGSIAWQEWKNRLVFDERGRPAGYQAVGRDITERKRAERALAESEEKFRALAESARAGIVLTRGEKFLYVNPQTIEELGYTKDQLQAMNFMDVVHPDSRELVRGRTHDRLRGLPVPSTYEIKVVTKGGETLWKEISSTVIEYVGEPTILATIFDVTERKRAEEALRESEEKFRALAEASPAMVLFHQGEKLLYANAAAETITGYSRDELLNMDFWGLIAPEHQDAIKATGLARMKGEDPSATGQVKMLTRRGTEIWTEFSAARVVYRGQPAIIVIVMDVTGRKRAEEALKEAKAQAELYLDLMGHDINNMHQIALGYLELARGMPPGVQHDEMMAKPIEVLQRSAQLIKNVRKLQKFHEGGLRTERVDVCRVLADVQREYRAVPGKTVTLDTHGRERCPVRANDLLHDVFANLVGNAIKHTGEETDIVIDLDVVTEGGRRHCRVSVEDDGPGIPDDFKGKVFNRLLKGTSMAKGMGLGLYLVKSLVDSYDGRVWVEDRVPGDHTKGAKFVVVLPVAGDDSH